MLYRNGFVKILELVRVTVYRKAVTYDERFLSAIEFSPDLYATGNLISAFM